LEVPGQAEERILVRDRAVGKGKASKVEAGRGVDHSAGNGLGRSDVGRSQVPVDRLIAAERVSGVQLRHYRRVDCQRATGDDRSSG